MNDVAAGTDSAASAKVRARARPFTCIRYWRSGVFTAAILTLLAAAYGAWFSVLSIWRHDSLGSNALDLGYYDQTLWHTARGQWFRFTTFQHAAFGLDIDLTKIKDVTNLLAYHVEPILVVISLLYKLIPDPQPELLLTLQSCIIALGVFPLYGLILPWMESRLTTLMICFAYLLAPSLEAASLSDFHPVAMTPTYALLALWCATRRQPWLRIGGWLLGNLFLVASKEEMSLLVAMLGVWALLRRDWLLGGIALCLGTAWFVAVFDVLLPSMNLGGGSPFLVRYVPFAGSTVTALAINALTHPHQTAAWLFRPASIHFLVGLFASGGFLGIFAPELLLPAAPSLAIDVFSTFSWMQSGGGHYTAPLVPFVVTAGALGVRRFAVLAGRMLHRLGIVPEAATHSLRPRLLLGLSTAFLISALLRHRAEGLTPLAASFQPERPTSHDILALHLLQLVPAGATLSADSALYPHLGHRPQAYLFPTVADATYVAVDVTTTPYPTSPQLVQQQIQRMLASGNWSIVAADDGVLILRRGTATDDALPGTFYSFAHPSAKDRWNDVGAIFGGSVELVGYRVDRHSVVDAGQRPIELTTIWKALAPLPAGVQFQFVVGRQPGDHAFEVDGTSPTTIWLPSSAWQPGQLVSSTLSPLSLAGYPYVSVAVTASDPLRSPRRLVATYRGRDGLGTVPLGGQLGPASWSQLLLGRWPAT